MSEPSRGRRRLFRALLALLVLGVAALGLEGGARLAEVLAARSAHHGLPDYRDTWRQGGLGPGGYLREGFRGEVAGGDGRPVRWHNNARGFRHDRETTRRPAPGVLRVLSLGDSFTAGYRVDQEATFSFLLERRAAAQPGVRGAEVLIAVVEEPVTGLDYLLRHGLDLAPDLVLLGVTLGNDVAQTFGSLSPAGAYRWTGGEPPILPNPGADSDEVRRLALSQPLPGRCLREPSTPRRLVDGLAKRSAAGRLGRRLLSAPGEAVASTWNAYDPPLLFDSNGLGIFLAPPPPPIESAWESLEAVLAAYRDAARQRGVDFVVALFPQRYQVQPEDWRETVEVYGLRPDCFDLDLPNRRLAEIGRRLGIPAIDPTAALAAAHRDGAALYFPRGDMHWNAAGHRAFAAAAWPALAPLLAPRPSAGPAAAGASLDASAPPAVGKDNEGTAVPSRFVT